MDRRLKRRTAAQVRGRLTYANVIATLALFVALGGTGYAAATLQKNSVGAKQLKNGAVTTSKLHQGAVTASKVAKNSLTGKQINAGTLGTVPSATHATTAGSAAPSGAASGALSGSYPNPSIADGAITTPKLADGAITTPKLADGAVDSAKVSDFSLRLSDLGGNTNDGTSTVASAFTVAAGGCAVQGLSLFNPAPAGVIGSLVVGYLTDGQGHAVLNNDGVVVPTAISETSQGGAIPNLMVCAASAQTVPVGSIFHYRLIGP